jgi:hypothetical protein
MHEGAVLKGTMSWKSHIESKIKVGIGVPLSLNGEYTVNWHDYSSLDVPNGLFRYAVHIVK